MAVPRLPDFFTSIENTIQKICQLGKDVEIIDENENELKAFEQELNELNKEAEGHFKILDRIQATLRRMKKEDPKVIFDDPEFKTTYEAHKVKLKDAKEEVEREIKAVRDSQESFTPYEKEFARLTRRPFLRQLSQEYSPAYLEQVDQLEQEQERDFYFLNKRREFVTVPRVSFLFSPKPRIQAESIRKVEIKKKGEGKQRTVYSRRK